MPPFIEGLLTAAIAVIEVAGVGVAFIGGSSTGPSNVVG